MVLEIKASIESLKKVLIKLILQKDNLCEFFD
jgi:hypothetical protein